MHELDDACHAEPGIAALGFGVEPVCASLPVSVTCSHFSPWPCVTTRCRRPRPRGWVPARCGVRRRRASCAHPPSRRPSSDADQFLAEGLSGAVLARIGVVLRDDAGKHGRRHHGGGKARALLVRPVGDDDGVLGPDAEDRSRAHHLEAPRTPITPSYCRPWAGYRDGCRHRPAGHQSRSPRAARTWCPSRHAGDEARLVAPAHEEMAPLAVPRRSGSGDCCRRRRRGTIFAPSHERIPETVGVVRRFSPGAAMDQRLFSRDSPGRASGRGGRPMTDRLRYCAIRGAGRKRLRPMIGAKPPSSHQPGSRRGHGRSARRSGPCDDEQAAATGR